MLKFNPTDDVTSRNPVKADPNVNNNVLLYLNSVNMEVKEQKLDANKAAEMQSEYAGKEVPRLYLEFKQAFLPSSDLSREGKDRFYVHIESPIVSFKNTNNPGEAREKIEDDVIANLYGEQFKHLMHIYKAFEGSPNYKAITAPINLDPNLSVDERIEMFKTYFSIFNEGLNGVDGKAAYLDEHGKPILLISKMIVNKNGRRLEFPTYTGAGFIEKAKISGGKAINTFEFKPTESIVVTKQEGGARMPGVPGGMPPTTNLGGLEDLINNA